MQSYDTLGCNGAYLCKTSVIDEIANGGIRFDNAYAPIALCSPVRYCVKSQPASSPLDTVFYCKYFKESRQKHILSYLYTSHELLRASFS